MRQIITKDLASIYTNVPTLRPGSVEGTEDRFRRCRRSKDRQVLGGQSARCLIGSAKNHNLTTDVLAGGHRLSRRVLAGLVRAGLVAAKREMVMAGDKAVEVIRVRITTAGRRALDS
jgi:hypothetical protein